MKCAWCSKSLRSWQSTKPLGCGYLKDTFGQREHDKCSAARRKVIEEGQSRKQLAKLRMDTQAAREKKNGNAILSGSLPEVEYKEEIEDTE